MIKPAKAKESRYRSAGEKKGKFNDALKEERRQKGKKEHDVRNKRQREGGGRGERVVGWWRVIVRLCVSLENGKEMEQKAVCQE